MSLNTIDLFCGCGGLSLGFEQAGANIVFAADYWEPALEVYKANFSHRPHLLDLASESAKKIISSHDADIIIGGPPCQDFSSAGPNQNESDRASLYSRFVDIVAECSPQYVVIENVTRVRHSSIFRSSWERLKELGYGRTSAIIDAAFVGVPQFRKRLFVICCRGEADDFLNERLDRDLQDSPTTLREYFGDGLNTDYYFRVPTNYKRRGVFSVDSPSMTIRAVDRPIPPGYPRHPEDPVAIEEGVRAFTIEERKRIQTFPDNFVLQGSNTNKNKMVGNAVPPLMARYVANAVIDHAEGRVR